MPADRAATPRKRGDLDVCAAIVDDRLRTVQSGVGRVRTERAVRHLGDGLSLRATLRRPRVLADRHFVEVLDEVAVAVPRIRVRAQPALLAVAEAVTVRVQRLVLARRRPNPACRRG